MPRSSGSAAQCGAPLPPALNVFQHVDEPVTTTSPVSCADSQTEQHSAEICRTALTAVQNERDFVRSSVLNFKLLESNEEMVEAICRSSLIHSCPWHEIRQPYDNFDKNLATSDHHKHHHESAATIANAATSVFMHSDDELRRRHADVTGNDVTHGGSKVRPSSDEVSSMIPSRRQSTGSISDGDKAARSQCGLSTADFSQQTVQDDATQTPVPTRSFDVDDEDVGKASTTVRVLSGLDDDAMTSCLQMTSRQPRWIHRKDTEDLSYVIALRDRSTQTYDVTTVDNSASSPNAQSQPPPLDDFYIQAFGLPAQEGTSFAESSASMSFRFDNDDNNNYNNDEETGSELLLCSRCGAKLTMHDATVGRYRALRELTPQPSDDVIESRERQARLSRNRTSSPPSLRHQPAATDDASEKVVLSTSENKRQIDSSEVLLALGDLLTDQVTCKRCTVTTNQPQSSCPPPPAGQEPNQNVYTATLNNTSQTPLANNAELPLVNNAGELMRYILHDIKKLKTTITRQGAARVDTAKRHEADVNELHELKKERQTRRRTPVSDDEDECRLSKGRHVHYDISHFGIPTRGRDYRVSGGIRSKSDDLDDDRENVDHNERRRRLESMYNKLRSTTQRSSKRNDSKEVNGRNYDHSPRSSTPPRREYHPRLGPRGTFMSGQRSSHQQKYDQLDPSPTLPPNQLYHQCPQQQQQQQHPQVAQQQFHLQGPDRMQSYPQQLPQQPVPTAFRPIHQMSPAQRQPLVFFPIRRHHQQQHHRQQQQDRRPDVVRHSTDVASELALHAQSQRLRDAMKLAKETRDLTARIYKRQKHVVT